MLNRFITRRNLTFNKYLHQLFAGDSILEDKEILLFLQKLSVLPSIEISFEDLYRFLVCENKENLEEILIELVNNGWLIKTENGYKFHQILKEFILENYTPTFNDIERIVDYFTNLMADLSSTQDVLDNRNYLIYLESLNKFIDKLKITNRKMAYLIHSEGYINFILGNYKKAKELYDKSMSIRQNILKPNDIQLAISYNAQASIYEKESKYKEALEFYQKSLKIRESNGLIEKIAIEYNNIGRMHKELGNYAEAFSYLYKSLKIRKDIFGEEHESTARAYDVLGSFYQDISKDRENRIIYENYHEKAYDYLTKALEIRKKILKNNHPSIAVSYNNLATWYKEIGDYKKAIEYFNHIINNFYGEENQLIIAMANFHLGRVYFINNDLEKALNFIKKAITIWSNILPEDHQYIIRAKDIENLIYKSLK